MRTRGLSIGLDLDFEWDASSPPTLGNTSIQSKQHIHTPSRPSSRAAEPNATYAVEQQHVDAHDEQQHHVDDFAVDVSHVDGGEDMEAACGVELLYRAPDLVGGGERNRKHLEDGQDLALFKGKVKAAQDVEHMRESHSKILALERALANGDVIGVEEDFSQQHSDDFSEIDDDDALSEVWSKIVLWGGND